MRAKTDVTYQQIDNESAKKDRRSEIDSEGDRSCAGTPAKAAGAKLLKMKTQDQIIEYLRSDFEKDINKESADNGGKFTSEVLNQIRHKEGNIENARSDKESWLDRAAWSARMVKKSLMTLSQADSDNPNWTSMEIALRMAEGSLDIYRRFQVESDITEGLERRQGGQARK